MTAQVELQTQQPPSDKSISFEDFLKTYSGVRAEWLAGAVEIHHLTNNTQHQRILSFLNNLLSFFLSIKGLGEVLLAGVPMYVGDHAPAREPDLMVILNEHLERIKLTYVDGTADIVVEIVSPDSTERDRGKKLEEYEVAGVPEYWLFDPLRTEANIYQLGSDGHYHPRPLDAQGRLTSSLLPGFVLTPSLLWQDSLPRGAALIAMVEQMR